MASNHPVLSKLKTLPSELRDQVYDEVVNELLTLELPEHFRRTQNGMMRYLHTLLPENLGSDPELAEEAVKELLRRTLRTAKSVKVPGPETFDNILPNDTTWDGVRTLEFTEVQETYASQPGSDPAHSSLTMHDIASRCPNLETLIFRMSSSMMLRSTISSAGHVLGHTSERPANDVEKRVLNASPSSESRKTLTPKALNDITQILRVLEHNNIRRLVLNCADAGEPNHSTGYTAPEPPYPPFLPFITAFRDAAELKKRKIEISIDLHPDKGKKDRRYRDGFTFIEYWDFW